MKEFRCLILFIIVTVICVCHCYAQREFHIESCKDIELLIGNKFVKSFNLPFKVDEKTTIKLYSGGWMKIKEFPVKIDFEKFKEASQAKKDFDPTLSCYILSIRQYRDLNKKINQSYGLIMKPQGDVSSDIKDYSFVHEEEVNNNYVEDRVALIIGNANYDNWDYIPTINSAIAVGEKLRKIGFHTIIKYDAKKDTINSVMDYLCRYKGIKKKIIKLFYFVGHGMRINNCDYIIPTDAGKKDTLNSIKIRNFSYRIDSLTGGKEDYNILFVDACRDGRSMYETDGDYRFKNNRTFIIPSTTNGESAYVGSNNKPFFSDAFVKNIDRQNLTIGRLVNEIFDDVKNSTNQQQKIATIPSVSDIEKKSLHKEKTMCWLGGGGTYQIPFEAEMPISFAPNVCFAVENIYLWRCKTQFEMEFGWNVLNKKTSPVYMYDDDGIKCASEFKNTWNASFRYGPTIYLCRNMSFSPMVGISYHHLEGYDKIETDDISSDCTTLTLDVELSYKFHRRWKVNLTLGTNVYRPPFLYTGYHTLKDVSFMKDWYGSFKNVKVGVGIIYRIAK